jgi:NitT/TauT family transport system ATP-binding protein
MDSAPERLRPVLEADNLQKSFRTDGQPAAALAGVDLQVEAREFTALVGPSGCGKTTLLRCLAGLLKPDGGEVKLSGRPVTSPPPDVAVVFQDYSRSLFPWLTAKGNVMLPLRGSGMSSTERQSRAEEALAEVAMSEHGDRYPWQLSGGMQQRVAIARAIAYRPKVLLLDEPFASVDAQARARLQDMILRVHRDHEMTSVFVTHDIDEAIYLSARVHVLSPGSARVVEVVDVDLPPRREQVATKADARFQALRGRLWRQLDATAGPGSPPAPRAG